MINEKLLIKKAFEAQSYSYAPYSNFNVGAALLGSNGKIYQGCNIENAAFSPTNCAERTAFFKAVSEGQKEFSAIAIVGSKNGTDKNNTSFCAPCGVCRQVMMEFCNPKTFKIIMLKAENELMEVTLEELVPYGFGPENLE